MLLQYYYLSAHKFSKANLLEGIKNKMQMNKTLEYYV